MIATAGEVTHQPFTENLQILVRAQQEVGYADGTFAQSDVQVETTVKGTAPDELSVAWLHSLTASDGSVAVIVIDGTDVQFMSGKRMPLDAVISGAASPTAPPVRTAPPGK